MESRGNSITARAKVKVKSGCRTCKIRKVKCDEGRPACDRCISTGRVCDGYGIWGGGGNFYGRRQRRTLIDSKESSVLSELPVSVSALTSSTEEVWYFEWFKCRTAVKLPGSFVSNFWTMLLFQASSNEPAVLHAVLALSSVQSREIVNTDCQSNTDSIPDEQEQFALRHYVKAIGHLQPHFLIKDEASFRVALITCVVFVYLEFLRGHFNTAQIYLQNGLKILRDLQVISDTNNGVLRVEPCLKSTDQWIVEAFSRLHLQVELFKHAYHHPCLVLQAPEPETVVIVFHTINEAWQQLERLLNKVFYLTHQSRQQAVSACESLQKHSSLLEHQQRILKELAQWLDMYEAFMKALQRQWSTDKEKAYQLLYLYHTMATIMADTCLQPSDELVYDSHTNQFVFLIRQLANLWIVAAPNSPIETLPGHLMDMSRSIVDMGWIPPLYYVAVKCRVHRIRLQAIRLLESTSHREGIWDAKTGACVARKVMEIEERDFYREVDKVEDFPLSDSPHPQDLALPALPESYRISEVEVILLGSPMDTIQLFCKRRQGGIDCRSLVSEYNILLRQWINK